MYEIEEEVFITPELLALIRFIKNDEEVRKLIRAYAQSQHNDKISAILANLEQVYE